MGIFSAHTLLVCVLVTVNLLAPAQALDFCPRTENNCQGPGEMVVHKQVKSSADTLGVSDLIQDITQLNVSCKNLMGKTDSLKVYKKRKNLRSLNCFFFLAERLPIDEVNADYVRTVKNCIFSKSTPTPLRGQLRLAALSKVGP